MRISRRRIVALGLSAANLAAAPSHAVDEKTETARTADTATTTRPEDDPKRERSGFIALPIVGYAPETSLVLGAMAMRYFHLDERSHATTLTALFTASFKEQFALELLPELHFSRNDYRVGAHLIVQSYPDRFYGVGNDVHDSDAESYDRRAFELWTNFRRRVAGDFFAGITTDQLVVALDETEPDGLLATGDYAGERGGVSSGAGVAATFDNRDDRTYTSRGAFVELMLVPFTRLLGSDYDFFRTTLDARYFVATWSGQVLGARYFFDAVSGNAPFYQLPQFGGPNSMRGYFRGKYRDENAHTLEAEYRLHVWWRFGVAVFAGVGQVGDGLSALVSAPLRPAVGGGLRFDLSGGDRYHLRIDAGGWSDDFGVYVALLEAF